MQVIETRLPGVLIIKPRLFEDERGYFFETYQAERYQTQGIPVDFVQDNVSRSRQHVVRGLHYQLERPQGKLVYVTSGRVLDVVVDIRVGSPTFGESVSVELDDVTHTQVYIPPGFAHGFCVLSESADFFYKCTDYYHPPSERGIYWNDPALKIAWPVSNPIVLNKDSSYLALKDMPEKDLPRYVE